MFALFASFKKNTKKISCYPLFIMLFPKYALKDLPVGSGSIIGRDKIKELFNHVSKHEDIEDRSLA